MLDLEIKSSSDETVLVGDLFNLSSDTLSSTMSSIDIDSKQDWVRVVGQLVLELSSHLEGMGGYDTAMGHRREQLSGQYRDPSLAASIPCTHRSS